MPPKPEKAEKPDKPDKNTEEMISLCMNQMRELLTSELAKLQAQFLSGSSTSTHTNSPHISPTHPYTKQPKISLLPFDGSNPLDWIFQAKQYFELSQTLPHQRLTCVPFYMQGPALAWYKWMHSNHQLTTWDAFTRSLELRFGPSSYENHQATLFKLRQTGTVMEYQMQFENISNRIFGLPADALLYCFLSGLRTDIQRELTVLRPYSLSDAIGLAKLVEAKIADSKPTYNRFPTTVLLNVLLGCFI